MGHDLKTTPTNEPAGQRSSLPAADQAGSESARAAADSRELADTLRAERDLLKQSLEARDADQAHALQGIRRSQDLAAEVQRLQRALEQSQMRVVELEGRCLDLEQTMRGVLVARDESASREQALQASLALARMHFQERIEQLGQSLATLRRLRQPDMPPDQDAS